MTTRDHDIADRALAHIELMHAIAEKASTEGDVDAFLEATRRLYLAHGAAFGRKRRAVRIWHTFEQATTQN